MRTLRLILPIIFLALLASACNSDDDDNSNADKVWNRYADWRLENQEFVKRQRDSLDADGKLFYSTLFPSWNPAAEILIHYFNDRELTKDNLQPMFTSTCDVIYYGRQFNGTPVDSSYTHTEYGRAIARFVPANTLTGFAIALMDMHVGDSVQIVLPYDVAYGASTAMPFPPFTALVFNMRLVNIPAYEIRN